MILRVDINADGLPDVPVIRQRLRPIWIDFESWSHDCGFRLRIRLLLERNLCHSQHAKEREKRCTDIKITLHTPHPFLPESPSLHPFSLECLAGKQVPFGIDRQTADTHEFTWQPATLP